MNNLFINGPCVQLEDHAVRIVRFGSDAEVDFGDGRMLGAPFDRGSGVPVGCGAPLDRCFDVGCGLGAPLGSGSVSGISVGCGVPLGDSVSGFPFRIFLRRRIRFHVPLRFRVGRRSAIRCGVPVACLRRGSTHHQIEARAAQRAHRAHGGARI